MKKFKNLVGKTYNKLTVISLDKKINDRYYWKCICECGNNKSIAANHLTLGRIKSCGCLQKESLRILAQNKRTGTKNITGQYYSNLRKNARKRNIEFSVSVVDLQKVLELQDFKCAITKMPLKVELRDNKLNTGSVDRIDSSKGYVLSNIHWVHKDVNKMKMDLDLNYFLNLCKIITENTINYVKS